MANFWKNIGYNFLHITFKGRSSNKEVVNWVLFTIFATLAFLILLLIPTIYKSFFSTNNTFVLTISLYSILLCLIWWVFIIWKTIAEITLIVRRLHDLDKTGWWFIGYFLVVFVILVVLAVGLSIILAGSQYSRVQIRTITSVFCNLGSAFLTLAFYIYCMVKKGNPNVNRFGNPVLELPTGDNSK